MIGPKRRHGWPAVVACVLVGIGICACSSSAPKASTRTTAGPGAATNDYYVSLGDSYAAGWEATGPGGVGQTTTHGYAYQVPQLAVALGYHLTVVNFGCGGATTASILKSRGCPILGPGAPSYPNQSQAAAAEAFLTKHQGKIGLITVSIGGNDLIIDCLASRDPSAVWFRLPPRSPSTSPSSFTACAPPPVRTYPSSGSPTRISSSAITYPPTRQPGHWRPVGELVHGRLQSGAAEAVRGGWCHLRGRDRGTGAYVPFDQTTALSPYGAVPIAVARVCHLTFFCQYGDVHPTTAGYTQIAGLIIAALPKK